MVPTRVTCPRINTATDRRPNPHPTIQPACHPLPHLLSTLRTPLYHSRVPIPILGSQHWATFPFLPHSPYPSPESTVVFLFPSLSPSRTAGSPSHSAPSCHYPSCFSFLAPSSFSSPARVLHSLSLSDLPLSPLNMPQGLVVSLGLACRLGQPPLLAKRSSKATGAGKA